MVTHVMGRIKDQMYCEVKLEPFVFSVSTNDYFFVKPAGTRPMVHNHASFELHYIFEGRGSISINEKALSYGPGTFYLIPPFAYHCDISKDIRKYMFQFIYRKDDSSKTGFTPDEAARIYAAIIKNTERIIVDRYGIGPLIDDLHDEASKKLTGYQFQLSNIFSRIIICMLRAFIDEKEDDELKEDQIISDDKRRDEIDVFFGTNYYQPVTPAQLAKKLMFSTRQLSRILKLLYDKSFKQKLVETRIEAAKYLLQSTDMPVNEICQYIGYESAGWFYSAFKEMTGHTPDEFRKGKTKTE